ncbi:MAG: hypothetical protein HOQ02_04075 [Lysobacter sp.]|nr:hypothetical protein [Lysobacter sp.]
MTRSTPNRGSGSREASTRNSGTASSSRPPLRRPGDDAKTDAALHQASVSDRGATVNDHLRDRGGKGIADDYDDSIDRDGAH